MKGGEAPASLSGLKILVTRPAAQATGLIDRIESAGGQALAVPLLEIQPLFDSGQKSAMAGIASTVAQLNEYDDLVFVSTNAVHEACRWFAKLEVLSVARAKRAFAIGQATAAALAEHGISARNGGFAMTSEALLAAPVLQSVDGRDVLILKGEGGRKRIEEELLRRGARVRHCALYRRHLPASASTGLRKVWAQGVPDMIIVNSGETLDNLVSLLETEIAAEIESDLRLIVPSERVAAMAMRYGFEQVSQAENASDDAVFAALCNELKGPLIHG